MRPASGQAPTITMPSVTAISQTGPIGEALRCTIAYERADWDNVKFQGLPLASIRESYMDAIAWARKLFTGLLT